MTHLANKQSYKAYLDAQRQPGDWQASVDKMFTKDAAIHVVHPFNKVAGSSGYLTDFLAPLQAAFEGLFRRDDILMAGSFEGNDWISATGYYAGHFAHPWLGIQPTGTLSYLRVGEFHRIQGGQAVESYVYLDIPQLMIASDQWPITDSPGRDRGYTGFLPGPATQDGLQLRDNDPAHSQTSAQMVTNMLAGLATKDQAWRPYWHDNMVWYGPAAFGSFVGIENFAGFQTTFEGAFDVWSGGSTDNGVTRHFTRHADGDYICTGGWPSLMAKQAKTFLGQPSQGDTLLMRVCDWWRRDGDLLVENWVFVDIPDVLLQMGCDLFPGLHTVAPGPRVPAEIDG